MDFECMLMFVFSCYYCYLQLLLSFIVAALCPKMPKQWNMIVDIKFNVLSMVEVVSHM